ncbi:MAG: DUF5106 domain-containing protein [Tannerella sp.]|jgi:hypothetical protein|nr:DUF5106 domain-containing protein [Tannerella sp.]
MKLIDNKCIVFLVAVMITAMSAQAQQQPDPAILQLMPEIPSNLTGPHQRARYLASHFWDKIDLSDIDFLKKDDLLERLFVDFAEVLSLLPGEEQTKSIDNLLAKSEAAPDAFRFIVDLSEKYLYMPASAVADEEKFIPFMQYALKSTALEEVEKIRPKFLLENVLKNRLGTVAVDFAYTLPNGETGDLHGIATDYTLLFFKDPECEDCAALTKRLIFSALINDGIAQGKLKIIAVYTGEDVDVWKHHASDVLNSWIYARDAEQRIETEQLYDVKHYPTIYLLGKDKKVLLKDTTIEKIEEYLKKI